MLQKINIHFFLKLMKRHNIEVSANSNEMTPSLMFLLIELKVHNNNISTK